MTAIRSARPCYTTRSKIRDTSVEELVEAFGGPVAALVQEVTDDKRLPKAERKLRQVEHAAHLSPKARSVKLADKIANLRDVAHSPPTDWPLARRQEFNISPGRNKSSIKFPIRPLPCCACLRVSMSGDPETTRSSEHYWLPAILKLPSLARSERGGRIFYLRRPLPVSQSELKATF
jgi:hypothetical protein